MGWTAKDPAAMDEAVYAIIERAARERGKTPSRDDLANPLHMSRRFAALAVARLIASGRIQVRGTQHTKTYYVPAIRAETFMPVVGRPLGSWVGVKEIKPTPRQLETLAIAERLIQERGVALIPDVALAGGTSNAAAAARMSRLAGHGKLRPLPGRGFGLPLASQIAARVKPEAVTTVRADGVRVTICPPMLARGALMFACGLGRGGVEMTGGGTRRSAGRAST